MSQPYPAYMSGNVTTGVGGLVNAAPSNYSSSMMQDPWQMRVRRLENGYLVSCSGKEYACTSGEELPALIQRVLVLERLGT